MASIVRAFPSVLRLARGRRALGIAALTALAGGVLLFASAPTDPARTRGPQRARAASAQLYLPFAARSAPLLTPRAQAGGVARDVDVAGGLAVVAAGHRLLTADVSEPSAPRFLGQSEAQAETIEAVAIGDSVIWASTYWGPLLGFDIRDPGAPRLDSRTPLPAPAHSFARMPLALDGDSLFVGAHDRVHRFDVSDPRRPRVVSSQALPARDDIQLAASAFDLVARDGWVYVVIHYSDDFAGRLVTVDWRSATAPRITSTRALDVNAQHILALAEGWLLAAQRHLRFYDLADPAAPVLRGWAGGDDGRRWIGAPRLAGIQGDLGSLAARGDTAWVLEGHTLHRLRMQATWPPELVSAETDAGGGEAAAGPGFLTYAASAPETRLELVDVAAPAKAARARRAGMAHAEDVIATATRLYVGGPSLTERIDVYAHDGGRALRLTGSIPTRTWDTLHVDDELLVDFAAFSHEIRLWDVRDPDRPRIDAAHLVPGASLPYPGVAIQGTLFVSGSGVHDGERVAGVFTIPLDGSAPPRFRPLDPYAVHGIAPHVTVLDGDLIAANEDRYYRIDPSSLKILAAGWFRQLSGSLSLLASVDGHLVAADWRRLEIQRLRGTDEPGLHAVIEPPGGRIGNELALVGRRVLASPGRPIVWELGPDLRTLHEIGWARWPSSYYVAGRDDWFVASARRDGLALFGLP